MNRQESLALSRWFKEHDVDHTRHFDVPLLINRVLAMLSLIALAPVLALVAYLIWRVDGAPIFFGHYRVGRDGRLFRCLKFRTMRRDSAATLERLLREDPQARAEWERDQKLVNDPRVTAIGRLLRRSSLDEIPQLLNVVRGEMMLVGPRPVTTSELTRYGDVRGHYFAVRPGITGLWQVSGRNRISYSERVALDRQYVESRTMRSDLHILLRTVRVVLLREGAS